MYEPQCVGHLQKTLFYTALAFIAVGISGHTVSFAAVFAGHLKNGFKEKNTLDSDQTKSGTLDINRAKPNIPNTSHSVNEALDTREYKQEVPSQSERTQILIKAIQKEKGVNVRLPDYRFPPLPPPLSSLAVDRSRDKPKDSAGDVLFNLQFPPVDAFLALVARKKNRLLGRRYLLIHLIPVIAVWSLPYIGPWDLRFGIPAIWTLVATFAFLRGFVGYKEEKRSKEGQVTNIFKVTFAACVKMFKRLPSSSELYENNRSDCQKLPHTDRLWFLDKAAIQVGPQEKLMLCTVTEVEETKIIFQMFPIWISLILCGVVASLGSTYFLEQAKHMNYKLGKLKLPDSLLLILHASSKIMTTGYFGRIRNGNKYAPPRGIAWATITATSCCIIAASVEIKRRGVIRDHGLIDKPDEKIPMTVFWLLPQYFMLGAMDSFYENSAAHFLSDQGPPSMRKYLVFLSPVLSGIGIMGSILSVAVVGRVSRRLGKPDWFQHDLNASRLDRYYWTLAGLSTVNFIWFLVFACYYPYRDLAASDTDKVQGEIGVEKVSDEGPSD